MNAYIVGRIEAGFTSIFITNDQKDLMQPYCENFRNPTTVQFVKWINGTFKVEKKTRLEGLSNEELNKIGNFEDTDCYLAEELVNMQNMLYEAHSTIFKYGKPKEKPYNDEYNEDDYHHYGSFLGID